MVKDYRLTEENQIQTIQENTGIQVTRKTEYRNYLPVDNKSKLEEGSFPRWNSRQLIAINKTKPKKKALNSAIK